MSETNDRREHPGLFRKKTWKGVEIDFTPILQTTMTLFVLMLMLGIPQWMIVVRMERMVANQVIIKENDTKIIDNQADMMRSQAAVIALISIRMSSPCSDCHGKEAMVGGQSSH